MATTLALVKVPVTVRNSTACLGSRRPVAQVRAKEHHDAAGRMHLTEMNVRLRHRAVFGGVVPTSEKVRVKVARWRSYQG